MSTPADAPPDTRRWVVSALCAAVGLALAGRIAAVFLLPNIDGDAYCYLDKAAQLRVAILAGTLRPADLFYAWLPLYPLLVALGALALPGGGHVLLVGKALSAASGFVVCWLVYRLLVVMTRRPALAAIGALLVAFDPWQTLYSSNSMTELPFEALVFAALDRAVAQRWTATSLCLVAAGFVRIEAWPLAALVPAVAFVVQRRVALASVLLVGVAPVTWLAISHDATGRTLTYFTARNAYVAEYLAYLPERAPLTAKWAAVDFSNLREAACLPLALGAAVAVGFLARGLVRRRLPAGAFAAVAVAVVYGYFLGFLLAAYVTRAQPVWWVRYGLIFQPLGVCLTLWWLAEGTGGTVRRVAVALLGVGILGHAATEAWIVHGTRGHLLFQRQAGAILAAVGPRRVFCDSAAVCVEAGIGRDRWRDSYDLRRDPAGFLEDLRQQGVDYLVFIAGEASTPIKLLPELADFRPAHGLEPFQKIASPDWRPAVLIYRVQSPPNGD